MTLVYVSEQTKREVARVYADCLSRRYPGTTWSPIASRDEWDEVDGVKRRLIPTVDKKATLRRNFQRNAAARGKPGLGGFEKDDIVFTADVREA